MEFIYHIMGICPDHCSHFNLMDFLVMGGGALSIGFWGFLKFICRTTKEHFRY